MLKEETKIRYLLGVDYHLCTSNTGEWALYRNYKDEKLYFANENEPIMNSKENTEKELLKFAKKHRKYNIGLKMSELRVIIAICTVAVCITNFFINSTTIRGAVFGINTVLIIECIVQAVYLEHNSKVEAEQLEEQFGLIKKIIKNEEKTAKKMQKKVKEAKNENV